MQKPDYSENFTSPSDIDPNDSRLPAATRRTFLMLGAGAFLTGCASHTTSSLPGPVWRPAPLSTFEPPPAQAGPVPSGPGILPTPGLPGSVLSRSLWSQAGPAFALMNRMLPIQYITVHHDGMDPFFGNDQASAAARLEAIRRAHRSKGWGDIGYHFAVDRGGRVWECRPISWQGAHVKDRNEGNIGICTLGNFDQQTPTQPQLAALNRHVSWLMQGYRVPMKKVYTHQEWPGAQTACPGTNLERYMLAVRRNGQIG